MAEMNVNLPRPVTRAEQYLYVLASTGGGGGGGSVESYTALSDKPKINGVTLVGDKSLEDLNITPISNADIDNLF